MPRTIQIDSDENTDVATGTITIVSSDSEEGETSGKSLDVTAATLATYKSIDTCDTNNEENDFVVNKVVNKLASSTTNIEEGEISSDSETTQLENILQLEFFKKANCEKYGPLVINTIKQALMKYEQSKVISLCTYSDDNSYRIVFSCGCGASSAFAEYDSSKRLRTMKEQSPDLSGLPELFMIDKEPVEKLDQVLVPSYKRAVKDVLLDEEAAAIKKKKIESESLRVRSPNSCFNCGAKGHNVRDCPLPHSLHRIRSAKKAMNNRPERYHADVEQRFSHLRPGCLSKKLKEALGLHKNELPFFFYRMRWLGYPPGWLEDAKVEHSGISLFNSDNNEIATSGSLQGEKFTSNHKYNICKIIDFPGFNQYPGGKFYDDYKYHKVPPFDKQQLKEVFIKNLGDSAINGYKRRKLKDFPLTDRYNSVSDCTLYGTDMEIEDPNIIDGAADPIDYPRVTLLDDVANSTEKPIDVINTSAFDSDNDQCFSPSLIELQTQHNMLIKELQTENLINAKCKDESIADEVEHINLDDTNSSSIHSLIISKQPFGNSESNLTTNLKLNGNSNDFQNRKSIVIKESYMGTPILRFTPYNSLPNGNNFKAGVSDVINFENLPDSTGKYEQMKLVIKKVRNIIRQMHKDEN